jgi:N-methylhydantoinase B
VVVALSYLIDPHTPKNDGTFRPVEVIAKPGTVVWANPGAPVTLATNHCGQEIIEAIIKALAPACPERAMAGWGRRFRIAIQGKDPRADVPGVPGGKPFIWHFFQARPGGGGSSAGDGWPGGGEWQAAGGIKFGSLEVTEVRFPLFFTPRIRPDWAARAYRGGPGGIVGIVVETGERRSATPPAMIRHGLRHLGSEDGLPHRYTLYSGNGARQSDKEMTSSSAPGDRFVLNPAAAAGQPGAATPIEDDVANGFVKSMAEVPTTPLPHRGRGEGRRRGRVRVAAVPSTLTRLAPRARHPLPHCGRGATTGC